MENGNGKKQEHRITSVEKDIEFILLQVRNHIPSQIKDLQSKFWWMITLLVAALVGIVATFFKQ